MPSDGSIMTALRKDLSDPGGIKEKRFPLLQELARFACSHENETEIQELVLRALEYRAYFAECQPILDALARQVGLFPYLNLNSLSIPDHIAYEFHRPRNMDEEIVFHRPQARIYRMLLDGESVALSAPTSFGKSLIIDAIIASGRYKNIVIIVPTIALIDETRRRLAKRFGRQFKIITHKFQSRSEKNIYVLTQERLLEFESLEEIEFFVIDEFYKLAPGREDDNRCWLLNQAFYQLAKQGRQFYMLGPGILGLSNEFQKKSNTRLIKEDYHTVVSELKRIQADEDEFAALIKLCRELIDTTIIFCSSPKRVTEVTQQLIQANLGAGAENFKGIGVHHGRIPRALAQYVVSQFNEGVIRFLVCTSTLIEGVNTKAKNMIILDNRINNNEIDLFTFNNIRGRSGRMFQHFIGNVYIFHDPPETELPLVDVPAFSQVRSVPESLLIQLEESDLTDISRDRLKKYKNQELLRYETLKKNVGIDLDSQLELAKTIADNPRKYHRFLNWSQYPTYEQLKVVCELIWEHFNGRGLGAGSVRSVAQLTLKINRLRSSPTTHELVTDEIKYLKKNGKGDADEAVQRILDFLRLWANFHFPRLLRVLDLIQRDIFNRLGMPSGNYEFFAANVENLFLDPAIVALDEYGIPLELARKLQKRLNPNGNLDVALRELKNLSPQNLDLSKFEVELLADAQAFI